MVVLCFGDIFAKPGRRAVEKALVELKAKYKPDIIIGNAENLAGGRGVNKKTLKEMWEMGFHGFTSGNHIWDNREALQILPTETRLIRPANYPSPKEEPCPGRGYSVIESPTGKVFLINLMGRVFMDPVECPFHAIDKILADAPSDIPILVDMHAETTSEKTALGHYLDGKVSAVWGTHTHIQTADETILPKGTAYITDIGMTGAFLSCIGAQPREVITRLRTKRRYPYKTATEGVGIGCIVVEIDSDKRATRIERLRYPVEVENNA